mgnify:CR=1 FL=1
MKLLPEMENHQEEFDRLKSIYERELQELFHIEDLENHNMDLSTTPSKKTDSLRKARDYSGNSIDPRDKMTTDSSNNPIDSSNNPLDRLIEIEDEVAETLLSSFEDESSIAITSLLVNKDDKFV